MQWQAQRAIRPGLLGNFPRQRPRILGIGIGIAVGIGFEVGVLSRHVPVQSLTEIDPDSDTDPDARARIKVSVSNELRRSRGRGSPDQGGSSSRTLPQTEVRHQMDDLAQMVAWRIYARE